VARTLYEDVSTACPSTILREHPDVRLYLDGDSSREMKKAHR
jgi:glucosamine-6-phosphate deaminase